MKFTKATRQKARLRLALTGPSGSGKTWSALLLAAGIGGKIAVVDTERESASLYEHLVGFDTLNLSAPYTPERYIETIKAAEEAEYNVLIIDSITHEWSGVGGCLELVDQVARAKYKGNSWSAWNDITPRHRALLDAILHSPMHIIVTLRSKTETAQTEENGRKKVVKLGMKAEQRDGFEYEMTVVLDIIHDGHFASSTKDRTGLFTDIDPAPITIETGKMILKWLEAGVEPQPEVVGVSAGEMADWQAAIEAAEDMDALVLAYKSAVKLARERKDKLSEDAFVASKDARKKQIEEAQPQPDPIEDDVPY